MRSKISLKQFLDETADRRSRYGGGSSAALACALAAALLEKLVRDAWRIRQLRAIRQRCVRLIEADARSFTRVLEATSAKNQRAIQQALKAATEVPWQIHVHAQQLLHVAQQAKPTISPRYRVDLLCVTALARASGRASRALVLTNLRWLSDGPYTQRMHHQLQHPLAHGKAD